MDTKLGNQILAVKASTDAVVAGAVATDACVNWGFSARASREVGIAAAELASNIVRHACSGTLEIQGDTEQVVLIATDEGDGIDDVALAQLDRVSRGQPVNRDGPFPISLGCGLGAVSRLMDDVQIEKRSGGGTHIQARKQNQRSTNQR